MSIYRSNLYSIHLFYLYSGNKGKVISGEEEGKPGLKSGQNPGSQGQEEPEMLGN